MIRNEVRADRRISNWFSRSLAFFVLPFVFSCAQQPTKTYTSGDINTQILAKSLQQPIKVTEETIVLDARPPFEFAVIHLPQAVNIQWRDFADIQGPFPGRLKKDLQQEAKRLALLGVTPQSQVIVVGRGLNGQGEEGRIAWTLLYLGVQDVQVAEADSLGLRYTNISPPPRANAPFWEPQIRNSLIATKEEVIRAGTSKHDERVHILDVRSKDEYFSKNRALQYEVPDLRAVNIEWKDFFTAQGRPNPAIKAQLEAINVLSGDRVIVISNNGIRSGAVTYALLSFGYKKAANFPGGYSELLNMTLKN